MSYESELERAGCFPMLQILIGASALCLQIGYSKLSHNGAPVCAYYVIRGGRSKAQRLAIDLYHERAIFGHETPQRASCLRAPRKNLTT